MLAVFPFHVAISRLLESIRAEPSRDRQFANPPLNRYVDAIRSGIADNKTHTAIIGRDASQGPPDFGHVLEIRGNHCVVWLLPTMFISFNHKSVAHISQLLLNRFKQRVGNDPSGLTIETGNMLCAGAHQMPSHSV